MWRGASRFLILSFVCSAHAALVIYQSPEIGSLGGGQSSTDLFGVGEISRVAMNQRLYDLGLITEEENQTGFFNDPANNTTAEYTAIDREIADRLDDEWVSQVNDTILVGSIASESEIVFTGTSVTASLYGLDGGIANLRDLSATTYKSSSLTLQDGAPTPGSLTEENWWNDASQGSTLSANGVLFDFSAPVTGFGLWFGDLENRDDGMNATAEAYLNGALVGSFTLVHDHTLINSAAGPTASSLSPVDAFTFDGLGTMSYTVDETNSPLSEIQNAKQDSTGGLGAGNHTTQFIGFSGAYFDQIAIFVGDDDILAGAGEGTYADYGVSRNYAGETEYLSFIGPLLIIPEPRTAVMLIVGLLYIGLYRKRLT